MLACAAQASGLDDFLAFNAATKTATARFEQQVLDRNGKVVETGSGTFVFARPGKFRWTYEKPHKQVLVADGMKLWIHDPDLNQVTVKRMDRAISSTPAALLAGRDDITSLFTLRDGGSSNGLNWVDASPKEKDTGFERVRLGLQGKALCRDGAARPARRAHDAALHRDEGERRRSSRCIHLQGARGRRRAGGIRTEEVKRVTLSSPGETL
jgi:outer membrane lipoprotein carrier protein